MHPNSPTMLSAICLVCGKLFLAIVNFANDIGCQTTYCMPIYCVSMYMHTYARLHMHACKHRVDYILYACI